MSKKDEALKLALEALKQIDEAMPFPVAKLAQKAIREALVEQPSQPYSATSDHRLMENAQGDLERITLVQTGVGIGKPEQEPVAWFSTLPDGKLSIKIVGKPTGGNWEPLYTTPPQRKPLTDEEALDMARTFGAQPWPPGSCVAFARAIEAAHAIKEREMSKQPSLTVIPSSDQKAMGVDLMNELRDVINAPKYDHMTIATVIGVLEMTKLHYWSVNQE